MIEWIVSSSVLIVIVTLLRFLLKGKISLRLQYALWALVLVRLLVPVSLGQSGFSVMNAVTMKQTEYYVWYTGDIGAAKAEPDANGQVITPPISVAAPGISVGPYTGEVPANTAEIQLDRILRSIWITGSAVAAMLFLFSNLHFAVRLRRSRQQVECEQVVLSVYVSGTVETPCLFGLFHPAIYVTPEVLSDETALRHVLAHETTHYRHGDHIWALLRCVCLALHWYNPLVWLAASLSRRDGELACDEGAIKRIGEAERMEYGRTLIGLTCAKRGALLTTATTMTGSKRSIKERITLIAKKPKTLTLALVLVAAVCLVAVGCTFTGAEVSPESSNTPETTKELERVSDVTVSVDPSVDSSSPMLDSAVEYVEQKIQALHDGWRGTENTITEGKITAITPVTAIAMENIRLDWYRLEYRLLLDGDVKQVLADGMTYEEIDGEVWLTERDGGGQPYLLGYSELRGSQIIWDTICITNDEEIESIYSTNRQLKTELGLDKYTIAAQELYRAYRERETGDAVPVTDEEIAQVNETLAPIIDDGEGGLMVNPLSCFFTSYYEDPRAIDLASFLAYFPHTEEAGQEEFEALKAIDNWPFGAYNTREQMPVPIHKISTASIDEVLLRYAGITTADLTEWEESGDLLYLEEYDAYYNFTSDFGAGTFSCVRGEREGENITLYSNYSVLTLRKSGENYFIQSFQPITAS